MLDLVMNLSYILFQLRKFSAMTLLDYLNLTVKTPSRNKSSYQPSHKNNEYHSDINNIGCWGGKSKIYKGIIFYLG